MAFRRICAFLGLCFFSLAVSLGAAAEVVIHRGNNGEPNSLDPQFVSGTWESNIVQDLFLGLTTHDARGELVPGAADRWEVSEDGLRYTFHIRENLKWSDGTPVTAEDFVFSAQRLVDPKTATDYASIYYVLRNGREVNTGELTPDRLGIRAVDAKTLELELHTPVPYLLEMLTHVSTYAVPKHVVEKHGAGWARPQFMVSNGPFKLAEWRPNTHVKLVRNPHFYEAKDVQADAVYFYPVEDSQTALKLFRSGALDTNHGFPASQYEWLKTHMPEETRVSPWLGVYYYAINSARPPFTDKRIRQALAMTVPREAITEKLLNYGLIPAYSFVPPGTANYPEGAVAAFRDWPWEKRVEKAKALLAEAGFGPDNPLEVTLSYNSDRDHKKVALAAAHGWKQIGVVTRLFNTEAKVHYSNLKIADFAVARAAWIADYNDAENFLFLLDSATGQLNYGQFDNPRFDALMNKARISLDLAERARYMREAEAIIVDEMPVIPIYFYVSRNLVQKWVKGWYPNMVNQHPTRYLRIEK